MIKHIKIYSHITVFLSACAIAQNHQTPWCAMFIIPVCFVEYVGGIEKGIELTLDAVKKSIVK